VTTFVEFVVVALEKAGIPVPVDGDRQPVDAIYRLSTDDWYVRMYGRDWLWWDGRKKTWVPCPNGPPHALATTTKGG
jgi:hypothetical protein